MNSKIKNMGLIAILPLFAFALTTGFVEDAEAQKGKGVPNQQYGSDTANIVCGGALCSEVSDGSDSFSPDQGITTQEETIQKTQSFPQRSSIASLQASNDSGIETTGISSEGDSRYSVWFQINGDAAQSDGMIIVSSDLQSKEVKYRGVPAGTPSGVSLDIRADDPNSIRAGFVDVETSVIASNDSGIELARASHQGNSNYDVSFHIYAGDETLSDGKILVSSDLQTKLVKYRGVPADLFSSVKLDLRANDPNSIHAVFQN